MAVIYGRASKFARKHGSDAPFEPAVIKNVGGSIGNPVVTATDGEFAGLVFKDTGEHQVRQRYVHFDELGNAVVEEKLEWTTS